MPSMNLAKRKLLTLYVYYTQVREQINKAEIKNKVCSRLKISPRRPLFQLSWLLKKCHESALRMSCNDLEKGPSVGVWGCSTRLLIN